MQNFTNQRVKNSTYNQLIELKEILQIHTITGLISFIVNDYYNKIKNNAK
jgi:hypothetical protein